MLLTVAIPTYNRGKSLRATLLNFISQAERHSLTDIEILVFDNCSLDDTSEICARIIGDHPSISIRYAKHETNIGFDRNVNALFGQARGTYVWTFSDDDQPGDDALPTVVELLRQREVRFAFVNYKVSVGGALMQSRYGSGDNRWLNASELLKEIQFSNSLISACIFHRQTWFEANPEQHFDTFWIHFFVARDILLRGTGLIIGRPMFTMIQAGLEQSRAERNSADSDEVEFFLLAHLKFVQFATELASLGYDRGTCVLAKSLGEREDIYQVINFKLTATKYSPNQIYRTWRCLWEYRFASLQFWLLITPLLLAPSFLVKLIRVISRRIKSCRS
ncbi:Glyco_tranf_GTA_type domain containing protein [Comamonadaceae bacterium]